MAVPTAATARPLSTPPAKLPWVHPEGSPLAGLPTPSTLSALNTLFAYVTGISRIIPCSATGTNTITLTTLRGGPQVGQSGIAGYVDYEVYSAVAVATSTGPVTASVMAAATPNSAARSLATLKVFKQNGAAQANTGDIVIGLHYTFTYVDSLDSSAGGFVLR